MPQVAYYGHHRCGSQYISGIIQEVCTTLNLSWGLEDHAMWLPKRLYEANNQVEEFFLVCWNSDYLLIRSLERFGFHVIRDPRDIIVSGYYAHLHSHRDDGWPRLSIYRNYLQSLDKEEGLLAEMEFSSVYLYQIFSWDYNNPLLLEKKFENLIANPVDEFTKIFSHLQITPNLLSEKDLHAIIDKYSFERLSGGRTKGDENVQAHYRKGVVGDWRNHFSQKHIDRFKKLFNPILLKTGYETDENW